MSDPGYGSYIASAAEAERNRRTGNAQLMKKLDMQKYGIDTSATTSRYATDTAATTADKNREQLAAFKDEETRRWNIGNERDQKLFDLGMEDRATSEEIGGNIVKNAAEKQRSEKIRNKLLEDDADTWFSNIRQGDIEADEYKGIGGKVKKWWRDEGFFGPEKGEPGYNSAYDPKYELNVDGERIDPQLEDLDLTDNKMTVENLVKYGPAIETADSISGKGSTNSLFNMFGLWK